MKIAVDFDGCLVRLESYTEPASIVGVPVHGGREAIASLLEAGHEVVIHSLRAEAEIGAEAIRLWLQVHGFPELLVTAMKPSADVYLDDRAYRFTGDWQVFLDWLACPNNTIPWDKLRDRPGYAGGGLVHRPPATYQYRRP